MLHTLKSKFCSSSYLGSNYLIFVGEVGRGGEFFEKKNPGPDFPEKNIQDRKRSTIRFVLKYPGPKTSSCTPTPHKNQMVASLISSDKRMKKVFFSTAKTTRYNFVL